MNLYEVRYYTLSDCKGRKEVKAVSEYDAIAYAHKREPMIDFHAAIDVIVLEKDLPFCLRCHDNISRKEMRRTLADDDTYRFTCPGCDEELLPPVKFEGMRL